MKDKENSGRPAAAPAALGLRERGKMEKLRRIKAAAREVFLEKGFESATTREIAQRADVAIGTIFVYAADKRDLLMLIINNDLDAVNDAGGKVLQKDLPLIELVMKFFTVRYNYWAKEAPLSRAAVQETSDFLAESTSRGAETSRFYARRTNIVAMLTTIVSQKQAQKKIADTASPELIAALFMTIYLTEVRRWLAQDNPKPSAGLARLRELLSLAVRGIGPAEDEVPALRKASPRKR
jgi:AcrR family transcriptional regulator